MKCLCLTRTVPSISEEDAEKRSSYSCENGGANHGIWSQLEVFIETKVFKNWINLVGGFKQVFHHIWDVILPIDELIFFKMFFIFYPQPVVEVGDTVTHQTYSNMIIFQDIIWYNLRNEIGFQTSTIWFCVSESADDLPGPKNSQVKNAINHSGYWSSLLFRESHIQWIGFRENLQESPIFNRKIFGFL